MRFWVRKWCPGVTFSLRAGAWCVPRPKSTKHCTGWRKLRFGPPHSYQKTTKIRCCGCSHALWRSERAWAASQRRLDGQRRLPGRALRRSWSLLRPPEPSREPSWALPDASQTALGRLSQRLQSVPECLRALEGGILGFFGRFGTDFPRSGRAFRSLFR